VTDLKGVKVKRLRFDYSELIVLLNLVNSKLVLYGYEKYVVELLTLLTKLERHLVAMKEVDNLETVIELKDTIKSIIGSDATVGVKKRYLKEVIGLYKGKISTMATPTWATPGHVEGGTRRSTKRKHGRSTKHKHSRK
jgi:hypothetical protein